MGVPKRRFCEAMRGLRQVGEAMRGLRQVGEAMRSAYGR